ncbi:MAG: MAPEG family protein [Cyanobacteria bacterium P01_F01_bin.150]
MEIPINTAWLAAYLIILQQVLMFATGLYRGRKKQGMGTQGDVTLERLVRRHGNLAENAGIFIVSLALLEIVAGPTRVVFMLCWAFAIARTLHSIGFSSAYGAYKLDGKGFNRLFLLSRAMGAGISGLSGIGCGIAIAIALAS